MRIQAGEVLPSSIAAPSAASLPPQPSAQVQEALVSIVSTFRYRYESYIASNMVYLRILYL